MFKLFQTHLSGVNVPHHKDTAEAQIVPMPIPQRVVLPMSQQIGAECELLVEVGDEVLLGQRIGDSKARMCAPIHASVSGRVAEINDYTTVSGMKTKAVVIESDGRQTLDPSIKPPVLAGFEDFIQAVRNSGLVGLGGAGFPSHAKLNIRQKLLDAHTLLVNAAECEPYITSDYRGIMEKGERLHLGIATVMNYLQIDKCIIGIEDNKPEAIRHLKETAADNIEVHVLPSRYPQGGEKVMIYEILGDIVEEGKLPIDYGIVVMNVSSLVHLGRFLNSGIPLTSKWITVAGSAVAKPQNVYVPLGTLYKDVIDFCGGYAKEPGEIFMGGPMMGIDVYNDNFPVLKNNNAIIALAKEDVLAAKEGQCIHCGKCVSVCPFKLMPNAIDQAQEMGDIEALRLHKANICMECGCCAYICPANRQLVLSSKLAKNMLREAEKRKLS